MHLLCATNGSHGWTSEHTPARFGRLKDDTMVLAVDVDLRSEAMRQAATKKDTAAESCPESWARAPRGGGGRVYGGGKDSVPQRLVRKPRLCTRDHRLLVKSACGDGTGTGSLIRRRTGGLSLGLGLGLGSRGLGLGR